MWKPILAATTALVLAGTSLVYAQHRPGREGPSQWRPNVEDMRAFGEARLAGLKAGLALNPEQEKNWPAFEQAARELAQLHATRMTAERDRAAESRPLDPAERINRRADALTQTGAALKKLGEATAPLYNSLDDAQKRRFTVLNRFAGPMGHAFRGRDGGMRQRHHGMRGMHRTDHEQHMEQMAPARRMMSPMRGESL